MILNKEEMLSIINARIVEIIEPLNPGSQIVDEIIKAQLDELYKLRDVITKNFI